MDVEAGYVEESSTAIEPLMNGTSSSIYQMVTNDDGTVSLVGLDPTQLDQLLHVQGDRQLDIRIGVIAVAVNWGCAECLAST